MSFVELQQVSRAYGNGEKTFYALDHIDLTMEKGEFVVVLGPSGAGKSTLLNLLGGMDSPTGGSIRIGDQDIAAMSGKQLTKFRASNVGFVFQFYNIMPTLTVEENVGIIRDVTETDYDVMDILARVLRCKADDLRCFPGGFIILPVPVLHDHPAGQDQAGHHQQRHDHPQRLVAREGVQVASAGGTVPLIRLKNGKVQSNELNPAPKAISEVSW